MWLCLPKLCAAFCHTIITIRCLMHFDFLIIPNMNNGFSDLNNIAVVRRKKCCLFLRLECLNLLQLTTIYKHYPLGTGESYGPTAQHVCKIAQSSLYRWTTYINEYKRNKVLPPHGNSLCHKVAYFLFHNFCNIMQLNVWPQLKNWRIFRVIIHIL